MSFYFDPDFFPFKEEEFIVFWVYGIKEWSYIFFKEKVVILYGRKYYDISRIEIIRQIIFYDRLLQSIAQILILSNYLEMVGPENVKTTKLVLSMGQLCVGGDWSQEKRPSVK